MGGAVPFVILGLLLTGPLSLYDLHKRFTAGISLFYSASYGSLQRSLTQLVAEGAVTVSDDPGSARRRKLHAITPSGRAQWREWMLSPLPTGADAETVLLAKVFLLGRLDTPADRRRVLAAAREQAAATLAELDGVRRELDAQAPMLPDEHREVFAYQRAVLEYGLRTARLAAAWVDELEGGVR
jgi:DNA-binding PadR family transcriptional regulator